MNENRFKKGDTAICCVSHYASVGKDDEFIVSESRGYRGNISSERGQEVIELKRGGEHAGSFFARNFINATTGAAPMEYKGTTRSYKPHLAVRADDDGDDYLATLNRLTLGRGEAITGDNLLEVQNAVKERIKKFPDERWLILTLKSLAATESPPVKFREF